VSAEVARPAALDLDPQPATAADGDRFAALFEWHAAHVFDYCHSLVADEQEASAATQATLITAYALVDRLHDASRLHVLLFALARRKCLSEQPIGAVPSGSTWDSAADRGGPAEEPDTEEIQLEPPSRGSSQAEAAALAAVPAPEREALDLVYRHAVSPADLPAILGISSDEAATLLAAAEAGFESADQGRVDAPGEAETQPAGVARISAIPLLALPPSLWRRTLNVAVDPELASYRDSLGTSLGDFGPDGFAPPEPPPLAARKLVLKSVLLGALLLAPATAGAIVVTVFDPPHVISHAISEVFGSDPSPPPIPRRVVTPHLPTSALYPKKRAAKTIIIPVLPKPRPSSRKPHPSPTAKNPTTSTSPFPSPSTTSSSVSTSPSQTPTSSSASPTSSSPSPSPTSTS
jgi:DNA-directed RNA polymerase specialized sigma24 family protein